MHASSVYTNATPPLYKSFAQTSIHSSVTLNHYYNMNTFTVNLLKTRHNNDNNTTHASHPSIYKDM